MEIHFLENMPKIKTLEFKTSPPFLQAIVQMKTLSPLRCENRSQPIMTPSTDQSKLESCKHLFLHEPDRDGDEFWYRDGGIGRRWRLSD